MAGTRYSDKEGDFLGRSKLANEPSHETVMSRSNTELSEVRLGGWGTLWLYLGSALWHWGSVCRPAVLLRPRGIRVGMQE